MCDDDIMLHQMEIPWLVLAAKPKAVENIKRKAMLPFETRSPFFSPSHIEQEKHYTLWISSSFFLVKPLAASSLSRKPALLSIEEKLGFPASSLPSSEPSISSMLSWKERLNLRQRRETKYEDNWFSSHILDLKSFHRFSNERYISHSMIQSKTGQEMKHA